MNAKEKNKEGTGTRDVLGGRKFTLARVTKKASCHDCTYIVLFLFLPVCSPLRGRGTVFYIFVFQMPGNINKY